MTQQQQALLDFTLRREPVDLRGEIADLRFDFEERMKRVPVPSDVRRAETEVGGVPVIDITIAGSDPRNIILHFHGGVFVTGTANSSVPLVADLARRTSSRVISVDYRLAPENPFPAAIEDAKAVYEGLLSRGVEPSQVAFAGESAGGGLAVAALLALRDVDAPMASAAFLMSPWVDLTLSGDSIFEKQAVDPILTAEGLRYRVSDYVGDASVCNPYISPVFADLDGLPPLLIQVGSHEILFTDAIRLAERAGTSDVTVTLDVVSGVPHVFQAYAAVLEEGGAALARASRFLNAHFGFVERLDARFLC